jgi:hypothetical protein
MVDAPDDTAQRHPHGRPRRLVEAFYSPDSYGLVLLLILVTYVLSVSITAAWAVSLVLAVQIATVWVTLRASQARRGARAIADTVLVLSAIAALVSLFVRREPANTGALAMVSGLLYLVAPFSIVRHLVLRRRVDRETVLGAIAAYVLAGMFFAFLYRALGDLQPGPFFGAQGEGAFAQDLFFSFTTLTTTGYGNLVPAGNPGQTCAVLEMLLGQLFLVTAVAKVVSAWRPGQAKAGLRTRDQDRE